VNSDQPMVFLGIDDVGITEEIMKKIRQALESRGMKTSEVHGFDVLRGRAWASLTLGDPGVVADLAGEVASLSGEGNPGMVLVIDGVDKTAAALAEDIRRREISKDEIYGIANIFRNIWLFELGGDGQGVIGAFAAAVLLACRYVSPL